MLDFTMVKRGYSPEEVQSYIGQLERSIEQYKEKDAAISNAILNAQVAADNIIKNAKAQAEEILGDTIKHLNQVHTSVGKQKELVRDLQEDYFDLVNKYLKNVQSTDFLEVFSAINELENYLQTLKNAEEGN